MSQTKRRSLSQVATLCIGSYASFNALTNEDGEDVSLKTGQNVMVTVEANSKDTNKK